MASSQQRNSRISVRLGTQTENVTLSKDEEKVVRWYANELGYASVSTFIREAVEAAGDVTEAASASALSVPEYLRTVVLAACDHTYLREALSKARRFVTARLR